jgi:hypothetical protein
MYLFRSIAASAISIANSIVPGQGDTLIETAGLKNIVGARSSKKTPVSDDQMIQHLVDIYIKHLNKNSILLLNVSNYWQCYQKI